MNKTQQSSSTWGSPLREDGGRMVGTHPFITWQDFLYGLLGLIGPIRGYSGASVTHDPQHPILHWQRLRFFLISHCRFYIATFSNLSRQRELNMKANTATQPKFFSGHREVLWIWTWVPFCWVFTETLKFQYVFASPLLLSKARWPCFQRMRLSINLEYSKISPSWGRARITKPWCHSDRNDPLDWETAHPSWLISSQPISQHLSLF